MQYISLITQIFPKTFLIKEGLEGMCRHLRNEDQARVLGYHLQSLLPLNTNHFCNKNGYQSMNLVKIKYTISILKEDT